VCKAALMDFQPHNIAIREDWRAHHLQWQLRRRGYQQGAQAEPKYKAYQNTISVYGSSWLAKSWRLNKWLRLMW
jgi:hypothetical protein